MAMAGELDVVAALVGRPWDKNPEAIDLDCEVAYKAREKVTLTAEQSDSLRAVLTEATVRFSEFHPGDYGAAGRSLAFYQGDPNERVTLYIPSTKTVTITSPDGLAIWHVKPEDASMGDLILASQRKVFKGDPLRPYLVVDPKWGMAGQVPGGWDTVLQIWEILGHVLTAREVVRLSKRGIALLGRAADHWERHRQAALHTRRIFETRGADITDVIETTRAAAAYQLADIMAWTGIDDPDLAADVAGWGGYRLDQASGTLSEDPDGDFVALTTWLPINMSIDGVPPDKEEAEVQAVEALDSMLIDRGLTE